MDIVLNITVISLLIITIGFCWRLNKKIIELKDSKKDLGILVQTFDAAIIKTHKSIADLKVMSQTSSVELQQYVDKAGELISDLSFMTNTAAKLADRLENAIGVARNEVAQQGQSKAQFPSANALDRKVTKPLVLNNSKVSGSNGSSKTKDDLRNAIKLIKQT
ncbi:hypothetical protein I862_06695 [endosymbiont of Acanthamoeba sp. UWC8]|uniref:DUF6468 domain-containing protein n=1 Tax=endosymbiont of Acanthamoeba sp. UWC8 TaxID=86106 RepID=UPI0004D19C79|nr:DUF6468 domain-containing protein [endosymbiont of Acanthamoeba sp. UWC8]AIF81893.1 hypothetical protein I862_06695 [endosymbiont of Acanthamoeba sp. UWC8]